MDIDYIRRRHAVSLTLATTATSREARYAHRNLARAYADRIETMGRSLALPAAQAL
ncbi:hypothetical protein [Sphingomonas sp. TDK1]|uniref:hypothetical protein n=1 Tax=Sphingomonas sp. TDK1 TaxID=453247 RepID=UPI000AE36B02|nr:hypothetical protein [Sphingomonas sp. TDK1]